LKIRNRLSNEPSHRLVPAAFGTALAVALAASLPAHAVKVTPPPVPPQLQVNEGTHPFLVGHALGTQNYVCVPSAASATGVAKTTQVQRLDTTGGVALGPGHGCDSPSDVGHSAFVDYTADYFFYTDQ
jgi:hypothetical protein